MLHYRSQTSILDFMKAHFNKLRELLGRVLWLDKITGKGAQDVWAVLEVVTKSKVTKNSSGEEKNKLDPVLQGSLKLQFASLYITANHGLTNEDIFY